MSRRLSARRSTLASSPGGRDEAAAPADVRSRCRAGGQQRRNDVALPPTAITRCAGRGRTSRSWPGSAHRAWASSASVGGSERNQRAVTSLEPSGTDSHQRTGRGASPTTSSDDPPPASTTPSAALIAGTSRPGGAGECESAPPPRRVRISISQALAGTRDQFARAASPLAARRMPAVATQRICSAPSSRAIASWSRPLSRRPRLSFASGIAPVAVQRASDLRERALLPARDEVIAVAVGHQQPGGVGADIDAGAAQDAVTLRRGGSRQATLPSATGHRRREHVAARRPARRGTRTGHAATIRKPVAIQ